MVYDPTNANCGRCIAGVAYMKYRISEDELKRSCKKICGRYKKDNQFADGTPDLFSNLDPRDERGLFKTELVEK